MMVRKLVLPASLLLALVVSAGAWMSPAAAQEQPVPRCFPETNYCIEGRIEEFWEQNGGLEVFGFPITPQVTETVEDGTSRTVQWFERNRLELHPENQRPYDVLLGRLGVRALEQQDRNWFTFSTSEPQPGCRYFAETRHNICEPFLSAWRANGLEFDGQPGTSEAESLALFGLPLSDAQNEIIEGQTFLVQYFERARFEHHPENPAGSQVLLGLLGSEVLISSASNNDVSGEQIAFTTLREGNQDIYVCPVPAAGQLCTTGTRLTNIPENDGQPTWSPDGSQIAFESDLDKDWEIYSIFANGSRTVQLSNNTDVTDGAPSWAALPDGWRIAFHSNRDGGDFDIYLMDSDNAESVVRLTSEAADDRHPALSPDGTQLAFVSTRSGAAHLYVANLEGTGMNLTLSGLKNLTDGMPGTNQKPVWSPDSSRLLFENTQQNNAEIYVINADGTGGLQNLTAHDAVDGHPTWSPDGTHIAFHSNREGGVFSIYMMNADGSNPTKVISHQPADVLHPAWFPIP